MVTIRRELERSTSVIGLSKAELVHSRGPWRGRDDLELATLQWVDWFNHRRLFGAIGYVPPAEYEANLLSSTHSRRGWDSMIRVSIKPGVVQVSRFLTRLAGVDATLATNQVDLARSARPPFFRPSPFAT
jgi:hypothetical protein